MVMKLKESESKLENLLKDKGPDNIEVPAEEIEVPPVEEPILVEAGEASTSEKNVIEDKACTFKNNNDSSMVNNNLKKVTNIENEQLNKSLQNVKSNDEVQVRKEVIKTNDDTSIDITQSTFENTNNVKNNSVEVVDLEIQEIESTPYAEPEKEDSRNEVLRKNIMSCVEKVALIEEMKNKSRDCSTSEDQVSVY